MSGKNAPTMRATIGAVIILLFVGIYIDTPARPIKIKTIPTIKEIKLRVSFLIILSSYYIQNILFVFKILSIKSFEFIQQLVLI